MMNDDEDYKTAALAFFVLTVIMIIVLISTAMDARAYQIFGTTGSVMSPVTSSERDSLSPIIPGVMVYNETTGAYQVWNGTIWASVGSGGGGTGTVNGPATTVQGSLPYWNNTVGTLLGGTNFKIPLAACPYGYILKSDGVDYLCAIDIGLLTTWAAGQNYKIGELHNSGSDGNWLFKVLLDHTSVNVPADFKAGKIQAMSPPIITTGVQDGGQCTLAGTTVTVQAGTGYIALYGESPSAYPRITIVEWPLRTITVPSNGIFTIFIDSNGAISYVSGFGDPTINELDIKISVGLVDTYLGKAYDRETYPTNPVGQLRGLAFFFGGMTKGLVYTPTNLQMARSQHDVYFWGANSSDDYNPNTKVEPAKNPVEFYEYTRNGAVTPATKKTTFRTDVYDAAGVLTTIPGNGWSFTRIYTALGVEDYVMYAQNTYLNEAAARTAAIDPTFIKPADLTLTKFSSWFVYQKNDANLADNVITVCEPFGCDKVGTSAGGSGGGGAGDVVGPAVAVNNTVGLFSGTTGKLIKEGSGITSATRSTLTLGDLTASGVLSLVPLSPFDPTKIVFHDDGVFPVTLQTNGPIAAAYTITLPDRGPANANQILQADANGTLSWINTPTGGGGNVAGTASAVDSNLASYSGTTGKVIKDSGITTASITTIQTNSHTHTNKPVLDVIPSVMCTNGLILKSNGTAFTCQADIDTDTNSGGNVTNATNFTAANRIAIANGANKELDETGYTIPVTVGTNGQVLQSNGTNVTFVTPTAGGTGDVVGPGTVVDKSLAAFSGTTGKIIAPVIDVLNYDALTLMFINNKYIYMYEAGVGGAGKRVQINPSNGVQLIDSATNDTLSIKHDRISFRNATYMKEIGLLLPKATVDYNLTLPTTAPAVNQILQSSAAGILSWINLPTSGGDVVGPTVSLTAVTDVTPLMTGLSAPAGHVASSSNGSPDAWIPFGTTSGGVNRHVTGDGYWFMLKYPSATTVNAYRLKASATLDQVPDAWLVEGSNDGTNFTLLDSRTGQYSIIGAGNTKTYYLGDTYNFMYYRFRNMKANNTGAGWTYLYGGTDGPAGDGTSFINIPSSVKARNIAIYKDITGKLLDYTPYRIPSTVGTSGQVLQSDGTDLVFAPGGNVVGPASSVVGDIAIYSDTTGKLLKKDTLSFVNNTLRVGDPNDQWGGYTAIAPGGITFYSGWVNGGAVTLGATTDGGPTYKLTFPSTVPANNQILQTDSTGQLSWISAPTGDVVGPVTGTDNAIARYDLNGKTIQNSGVLIDDSNNISAPAKITAVGPIVSTQPAVKANLIFDFNEGNNQYTTSNCGAVQLNNTVDGGVYSIAIAGATPALCSFTGTPSFTVHMPVPHGSTTASTGKHTLYTFTRLNGHIYVGWSTGI